MKKLMPIPKLYNFNSKVLQNLSKIFFFLICFFSLFLLTTFFHTNQAYANDLRYPIEIKYQDGEGSGIFYLSSKMAEIRDNYYIKPDITQNGWGLGRGCYFNGIHETLDSPKTAYNKNTNSFTDIYPYADGLSPSLKKKLSETGFCAPIRECKKNENGDYFRNDSGVVRYAFFKVSWVVDTWEKIFSHRLQGDAGPADTFYTSLSTPIPSDHLSLFECNKKRVRNDYQGAFLSDEGAHKNCTRAFMEGPPSRTEDEALLICANFFCDNRNQVVRQDWDDTVMHWLSDGTRFWFSYNNNLGRGSCAWLQDQLKCKIPNTLPEILNSCTYDGNGNGPVNGDCYTENEFFDLNTLGVTGQLRDKNIFCKDDNTTVACPSTVRTYTAAFERRGAAGPLSIKPDSGCVAANSLTAQSCQIPPSSVCTFGDPNNRSDNCYSLSEYNEYIAPHGGNRLNLFCNGRNQTIACRDRITSYAGAFPGITGPQGPFNYNRDECSEFIEGMQDIVDQATLDCELPENGMVFAVQPDGTKEVFDFVRFRNCIAIHVRNGFSTEDANQNCMIQLLGQMGRIQQCTCDVSHNPRYNFFLCAINPGSDDCTPWCILQDAPNAAPIEVRVQAPVNPLGVIKTISDFLFALAVLIFIINLLRASFMYVTSGGDEGKMKEAQSTITNTIFGMVFIVFIGALLRWVIGVTQRIVE